MTKTNAGTLLREAREQASLSQRELADAASTSQSVVGRIEAGLASPSVETLARLVSAAGFELRLSLEPTPSADPIIDAFKADIDQTLLVENLRASMNERLRINAHINAGVDQPDTARAKDAGRAHTATDLSRTIAVLHTHNVEFILAGGIAARVFGSARVTQDIDVVYSRSDANIARVVKAFAPFNPYPRNAPPKLPFAWTTGTVKSGLNFSLQTTLGDIDLLGDVVGGGRYEDLTGHCVTEKLFGHATMVVSLPWLIRLKRAAGQARDFEAIAELELIQDLGRSTQD